MTEEELEQFLIQNPNHPQALVLSAFLQEKREWNEELDDILEERSIRIELSNEILDRTTKESWFTFVWRNLIRRKLTSAQEEFNRINEEIDELQDEYDELMQNPPNTDMYEIAILGNNLFHSRS